MNELETQAPTQAAIAPQQSLVTSMFVNKESFEYAQRVARMFSQSSMVPKAYRGEDAMANCLIAVDMANRLNANPLMVMQNLYVVEGHPAWSSKFLIATVNASGNFSSLRYEMSEPKEGQSVTWTEYTWRDGRKIPEQKTADDIENRTCHAWAYDLKTGEKLVGTEVSIVMAIQERWFFRAGSKWQTMPELMLRYRAASFWVSQYSPELSMGIPTAEEVGDVIDVTPQSYKPEPADNAGVIDALNAKASRQQEVPAKSAVDTGHEDPPKADTEQDEQDEPTTKDPQEAKPPTIQMDSRGFPWNPMFHSAGKRTVANGSWRLRRGCDLDGMRKWEQQVIAERNAQELEIDTEDDDPEQAGNAQAKQEDPAETTTGGVVESGRMVLTPAWFYPRIKSARTPEELDELLDVMRTSLSQGDLSDTDNQLIRAVFDHKYAEFEGQDGMDLD